MDDDGKKDIGCTVAAFKAPAKDFPFFSITRKGIATWLEPNRIQIEEDTPFSERFAVTGTDESAVRAVFSPAHRHYLISEPLPEKILIEGAGSWLVLYRRNKNIHPEHWKEFVDQTSAIARSFLQYCQRNSKRQSPMTERHRSHDCSDRGARGFVLTSYHATRNYRALILPTDIVFGARNRAIYEQARHQSHP